MERLHDAETAPASANGKVALAALSWLDVKSMGPDDPTGTGHPSNPAEQQIARLEFFFAGEASPILTICASDRVVGPGRLLTALGAAAVRRATQEEVWVLANAKVLPAVVVDAPLLDEPVLWIRSDPKGFDAVDPETLRSRWKARVAELSL